MKKGADTGDLIEPTMHSESEESEEEIKEVKDESMAKPHAFLDIYEYMFAG